MQDNAYNSFVLGLSGTRLRLIKYGERVYRNMRDKRLTILIISEFKIDQVALTKKVDISKNIHQMKHINKNVSIKYDLVIQKIKNKKQPIGHYY